MNILFLAHRIPFPPNKGDKIRSFNEISYLSRKHNLYLAFLIDDPKDIVYVDELKKYCEGLDYDIIRPRWQKIKSIPYLFTGKPLSIPYFYSKKLQDAIDMRLKETPVDAIICFSSPMAEYVFKSKLNPPIPPFKKGGDGRISKRGGDNQVKLIMDFVDVDSDKWRMYAEFSVFPFSAVYRREWKRLKEYEKRVGKTFDLSVLVSDKEAEFFKSLCPEARVVSIPNGVDMDYYKEVRSYRVSANPPTILFMGAMDYFPNEDAVLYFSNGIWPHVKKVLPDAKFYVLGGRPSKKVQSLSLKDRDIIVTGFVSDTRPYLKKADVFVAPLRIARGIQNKILEAMAAGAPVVASPEAVQGLNGYDGCIRVERDDKKFAFSIIELIQNQERRQKVFDSSFRFILDHHNWRDNLRTFEEIIDANIPR